LQVKNKKKWGKKIHARGTALILSRLGVTILLLFF
jgi:hypothetical protein